MGKYYYLISGLPELQLDNQKLAMSMTDFKAAMNEQLSESDKGLIAYFFMQFDNKNLLKYLNDPETTLNPLGNIKANDFEEIMLLFKETDKPVHPKLPKYFTEFIPAYYNDKPLFQNMSPENQLTSLYYDYATQCKNEFIAQWFRFNLAVNNILTAVNCRNYSYDRESSIIGTSPLEEAIRYSNSRDFGIAPDYPMVDDVLRIAEIENIYEREQKIDMLKWNWLEENGFFHYFDIEHLFIYLIKLQMLSRWVKLEKESGQKAFRSMIERLQQSFEFPNEFTIVKVK